VIRLAEELASNDTGLPPTRIGPVHINIARARLDLGDRNGAQTLLGQAWSCPAPQRSVARCSPLACLLGP
jgi:hypothetical protein